MVAETALLITCSWTSIQSLIGKSISVLVEPSVARLPGTQTGRPKQLLVTGSSSLHWSFPVDECQSWFACLSHFWEYWPRRIQFSHNGKPIIPDDWPNIHAQACKAIVRIHLETSPNVKEPVGGILLATEFSQLSEKAPPRESDLGQTVSPTIKRTENDPSAAERSTAPVQTDVETTKSSRLHPDTAGKNQPADLKVKQPVTKKPTFHVFAWMNQIDCTTWPDQEVITHSENLQNGNMSELNLKGDLKEMDRFLKRNTSFVENLAYKECPQHSRKEVYTFLGKEEDKIIALAEQDDEYRKIYEIQADVVYRAELLFSFFLPSCFDGHTVGKLWGAIYSLIMAISPVKSSSFKESTANQDATTSNRSIIELSEEFPRAWLHLLMALPFCVKDRHIAAFEVQSDICSSLISEGTRKSVRGIAHLSLVRRSAFMPSDIVSLINLVLLGDITPSTKTQLLDISDTYLEYLSILESNIESNPLDRGHQDKITSFKQEIIVILDNLMHQSRILTYPKLLTQPTERRAIRGGPPAAPYCANELPRPSQIERSSYREHGSSYAAPPEVSYVSRTRESNRSDYDPERARSDYVDRPDRLTTVESSHLAGSHLDPTDPSGVQGLLIQETQSMFDPFLLLERPPNQNPLAQNIQNIDYNKDRQEAAVYAFTIVTIIFLPLSTVASILGMNVNDVRNMELTQWVFWVTAIPLTFIIITLCLIWAGELRNFWTGFSNIWSRRRSEERPRRSGYYGPAQDWQSMLDGRADDTKRADVASRRVPLFRKKAPEESDEWI
ncbi:uncharacterized protein PAC_04881 [Phialocephala subalpina]|uniref:Uncharacterized protein n=1 Tax=Phialocephala subalpina TaxID=576137 RepID=A0A1L7WQF0_9HELO|nr:uncharacterized protein PAC_04881 [Phialocephala subalpina]